MSTIPTRPQQFQATNDRHEPSPTFPAVTISPLKLEFGKVPSNEKLQRVIKLTNPFSRPVLVLVQYTLLSLH